MEVIENFIFGLLFPGIAKDYEKKQKEIRKAARQERIQELQAKNPTVTKSKQTPLYQQRMFNHGLYLDDLIREHGSYKVNMVERHLAHRSGPHRNDQVTYRKVMQNYLNHKWSEVTEWAPYYAKVEQEDGY